MIQLAYNLNGLRHLSIEQACHRVADAGFEGVEISLHPNHLDPFGCRSRDLNALLKLTESLKLKMPSMAAGADDLLSTVNFEPSLVSASADGRRQRIDLLRRSIVIAEELGIANLNFASGIRRPQVSPEQATQWLHEGMEELLDFTETVTLTMEPEPGFFLQRNAEVAGFIERLEHPRFRLAQDLGHTRVVDDDYLDAVRQHLNLTPVIQVEDIKGRVHNHEIPGDGDIDWQRFGQVLAEQSWSGWLSVELYNQTERLDEALSRSIKVLRQIAK